MLFISLLLPVAASAAVLQERQGLAGLLGGGKPATVINEKAVAQYRKTANRNLYKVGRKHRLFTLFVTCAKISKHSLLPVPSKAARTRLLVGKHFSPAWRLDPFATQVAKGVPF